jgi:hypothetical protein
MKKRFGSSITDRAMAAAVAHVIVRLSHKHPWIAADLLVAGLGRGVKVGVDEIAKHLRGRMEKPRTTEETLLLEATNDDRQNRID